MRKSDEYNRTQIDDRDPIAELLRLAGPRAEVPALTSQRVRLAVREEWRHKIHQRNRRKRSIQVLIGFAAAAGVVIAAGLLLRPEPSLPPSDPPVDVARVSMVIGSAQVSTTAGSAPRTVQPARSNDTIRVGDIVETDGEGLASLQLGEGQSLRIHHATRFWFTSPNKIHLERGTLFFDSGPDATAVSDIHVETAYGVVHEIGTQFEVRLIDRDLRIRVREGAVDLEKDSTLHRAEMGSQLLLHNGHDLTRQTVPIYGPEWDWILSLSPEFNIEGRTLAEFLEWVSRETGWDMQISDRVATAESLTVTLHGSITGLRPDEALEAVLPTCDLRHAINGGNVLIDIDA